MKYLRLFENNDYESFKVGDIVICINKSASKSSIDKVESEFLTVGEEYEILKIIHEVINTFAGYHIFINVIGDDGKKIKVWSKRFKYPDHYKRSKKIGLWDMKGAKEDS